MVCVRMCNIKRGFRCSRQASRWSRQETRVKSIIFPGAEIAAAGHEGQARPHLLAPAPDPRSWEDGGKMEDAANSTSRAIMRFGGTPMVSILRLRH